MHLYQSCSLEDHIVLVYLILRFINFRFKRLCFPLEASPTDEDIDDFLNVFKVMISDIPW